LIIRKTTNLFFLKVFLLRFFIIFSYYRVRSREVDRRIEEEIKFKRNDRFYRLSSDVGHKTHNILEKEIGTRDGASEIEEKRE